MKISPACKHLFYIIFILFVFSSCNDNITGINPPINSITSIEGNITGMPDIKRSLIVYVIGPGGSSIVGADTVGSDSTMNITLDTPTSESLYPVNQYFVPDNIQYLNVSDTTVLMNNPEIAAFKGLLFCGLIYKTDYNIYDTADFSIKKAVSIFYCDKPLSMTGIFTNSYGNDTVKTSVNLNFVKGWNLATYRSEIIREHYKDTQIYDGEAPGCQWYFVNAMDNNSDIERFKNGEIR